MNGESRFREREESDISQAGVLTPPSSRPGNKKDNVNIVYTPWSNLKKDGSMAVGQVGFKDQRKVKKVLIEARTNAIINRLNKTKTERFPDLAVERDGRDRTIRDREKKFMLERVRTPSTGPSWDGETHARLVMRRCDTEEGRCPNRKGAEGEGVAERSRI